MRSSIRPSRSLAKCLFVLALALPAAAHGKKADDAATEEAKGHYQKGRQFFEKGDYPAAITELKQAYVLKKLPAILFNIGQTYRKLGDREMALFYFDKFLKEAPADASNRAEAQSALEELKAEAAPGQGGLTLPAPLGAEPTPQPPPAPQAEAPAAAPSARSRRRVVEQFEHTTVEEAPPARPLDIRVLLPDQEGLRATVYCRGAGQESFVAVSMRPRYDEWVGRIPASLMAGRLVQYYVEARDAQGAVIGKSGSPGTPNIVMLNPKAPPQFYADLTEGPSGDAAARAAGRAARAGEDGDEEDLGRLHNFKISKWIFTGAAVVALSLGTYFAVSARSDAGTLEDKACRDDRGCQAPVAAFGGALQDAESSGQSASTMATVSLLSGAALGATAVVLWLLDDSKKIEREHRKATYSVAPLIAPPVSGRAAMGLSGTFSF